jgi:cytochrome c
MPFSHRLLTPLVALLLAAVPAAAQLAGHGGPVRAVAVAPDGRTVLSGGFDTAAIRWSLATERAEQVLRFHSDAVNAVTFLPDGRFATAGADGRIALWRAGAAGPERVFEGHEGPVVGLAAAPDGRALASASWDRSVRLWPLDGGAAQRFDGHEQNANAVAFAPDGRTLVSVGYDATLRLWPREGGAARSVTLPAPLNAVAVAADGEIVVGGADGIVRFRAADGSARDDVQAVPTPVIALALSPDGKLIAAAGVAGAVAVIDRATRQVLRTLVGPGLPVWSVAFLPDGATLLTGGADGLLRRWDARNGEPLGSALMGTPADPLAAFAGDRGAEIFRACIACHALREDATPRAGPSLAQLFGRRIASRPDYAYSEALRKLDIVWTPETVAALFDVGPAAYTPGTKMPEQRIGSAEDRKALVEFLAKATR